MFWIQFLWYNVPTFLSLVDFGYMQLKIQCLVVSTLRIFIGIFENAVNKVA